MKKIYLFPLLGACLTSLADTTLPAGYHAATSSLAEGHWVKIRIDGTGVYELTFDRLREMGFDDPAKVAVFGRGLKPLPDQFVDPEFGTVIDADLYATPRMVRDDKLYFFGTGHGWIDFLEDTDAEDPMPRFERRNVQMYSKYAYYLLTDSQTPLDMEAMASAPDPAPDPEPVEGESDESGGDTPAEPQRISSGYSYILHDVDQTQGFFGSGRIYFGERFSNANRTMSWDIVPQNYLAGSPLALTLGVYADDNSKGDYMNLSLGDLTRSKKFPETDVNILNNFFPDAYECNLTGNSGTLKLNITGSDEVEKVALDYWLVSYDCTLPSVTQGMDYVVVPPVGEPALVPVGEVGESTVIWNVADPAKPVVLAAEENGGENCVSVLRGEGDGVLRMVAFDASQPQMQPEYVGDVANSNLHQLASHGTDLLIITVPAMRQEAERLAALHRGDGLDVIVANVADIYNEYNSGQPSIMAYRSLVRQLYDADRSRFLNVLLFGSLVAETKGVSTDNDPDDIIIAYQSPTIPGKGDPHNVNDFIGMMTDYINSRLEYVSVEVGVGIIPSRSVEHASLAVDKVERYMAEQNYDMVCNKLLGVAGAGDSQMHTTQVLKLGDNINNLFGRSLIFTPYVTDAFTKQEQLGRFTGLINSDYVMTYYLGHGSASRMNGAYDMFVRGNESMLDNNILTFFFFGTCDICEPDRGGGGIGDGFLFDTRNGMVGGVVSTRTAYSNQNESFCKLFMQYLGNAKAGQPELTSSKTVGQAFAEAKTQLRTLHENTFSLMCDPALKLAMPVLSVETDETLGITLSVGQKTKVSGYIATRGGNRIENFNGRLTAKVLAPSVTMKSENLISHDTKQLDVVYADNVLGTYYADVHDGRFEVTVEAPVSQYLRQGVNVSFALSAYDPATHTAASGKQVVSIDVPQTTDDADTTPPAVDELYYDPIEQSVHFTVSDDRTLNTNTIALGTGLEVYVDGRRRDGLQTRVDVTPGSPVTATAVIPCESLGRGDHSVSVRISDFAGNTASRTEAFTIGDTAPSCTLAADAYGTRSGMTFTVDGIADSAKGRLMIADTEGNVRLTVPFEGKEVYADMLGEDGVRLPEGVYRAWVIYDAPGYEHSDALHFAVLNPGAVQ